MILNLWCLRDKAVMLTQYACHKMNPSTAAGEYHQCTAQDFIIVSGEKLTAYGVHTQCMKFHYSILSLWELLTSSLDLSDTNCPIFNFVPYQWIPYLLKIQLFIEFSSCG